MLRNVKCAPLGAHLLKIGCKHITVVGPQEQHDWLWLATKLPCGWEGQTNPIVSNFDWPWRDHSLLPMKASLSLGKVPTKRENMSKLWPIRCGLGCQLLTPLFAITVFYYQNWHNNLWYWTNGRYWTAPRKGVLIGRPKLQLNSSQLLATTLSQPICLFGQPKLPCIDRIWSISVSSTTNTPVLLFVCIVSLRDLFLSGEVRIDSSDCRNEAFNWSTYRYIVQTSHIPPIHTC